MTPQEAQQYFTAHKTRYVLAQFVDIHGAAKAKAVPVELGLQTDTLAEIRSPDVPAGTTVITTRPDALQDKSIVAMSAAPGPGAGQTAR